MFDKNTHKDPGKWFDWTVMGLTMITIFALAHMKKSREEVKAWGPKKR